MKLVMDALGKRPVLIASLGGGERLVDSTRRAAKLGADLIEIRIDTLKPKERANIADILAAVKEVSPCPLIATVRSSAEQGPNGSGERLSDRDRKILIDESIPLVDMLDIEFASVPLFGPAIEKMRKLGKKLILSYHDFESIPSQEKLKELGVAFEKYRGDIFKVAGMARTLEDVIKILEFCRSHKNTNRVFIAMGDCGRISRVAGFFYGSCFTYGYMNKPTAPGQLSVQELTDLCALFYPAFRAKLINT